METWQEHCLEKRVAKDFKWHSSMFSPGFCKDVAKMPDWGCGAHDRGHFGRDSCSCKNKSIQSIPVHLDFIQIKDTSIKKEKVSRKKPILRKDLN